MRHQLFIISPITKERLPAKINWVDEKTRQFGFSYVDLPGDLLGISGDVLNFGDTDDYELVRIE